MPVRIPARVTARRNAKLSSARVKPAGNIKSPVVNPGNVQNASKVNPYVKKFEDGLNTINSFSGSGDQSSTPPKPPTQNMNSNYDSVTNVVNNNISNSTQNTTDNSSTNKNSETVSNSAPISSPDLINQPVANQQPISQETPVFKQNDSSSKEGDSGSKEEEYKSSNRPTTSKAKLNLALKLAVIYEVLDLVAAGGTGTVAPTATYKAVFLVDIIAIIIP